MVVDGLDLADPEFFARNPVELLLGADACAGLVQPGLRRGRPGEPIAQQTQLGWIILDAVGVGHTSSMSALQCSTADDLSAMVRRFWEQGELPRAPVPLSAKDLRCEVHFCRTHGRDSSGRYTMHLPTRAGLPDLSSTRRAASHMMDVMSRHFQKDPAFRQLYENFMREYLALGHMTLAAPLPKGSGVCYLPHHGVLKGEGLKIRVVFNSSSRAQNGCSLNESLLMGPNLLPALSDVVTRWRRHRYVLTADIEKIYQ